MGCIQIKQFKLKSNVLSSGEGRENQKGQHCLSGVRRKRKSVEIRSQIGVLFMIFVESFKKGKTILN